jgi:glycerol-3-phosphate acyltransferase PlsY
VSLLPWFGASYLLGAIPTSYLVVRLIKRQDLRNMGSGNLGATNLYRALGLKYALPVALFDVAKGAIPVLVFAPRAGGTDLLALLLGITAVLGHMFSVFVGFRGGKGVATAAGVVLGLAPWALLAGLAVWLLTVFSTGYVSIGSIAAAILLPFAVYWLHPERREMIWLFAVLSFAIVVLHRANISRLLAGTEHRFGRHRGESDPAG